MILVIGGSGFIGSTLVKLLIQRRETVRVYDKVNYPPGGTCPSEMIAGDILDIDKLSNAMQGCRTVFHLAGNAHLWARRSKVFDQVNRQGTENVIQACKQNKIERLVYTSTESILIPPHGHQPITEEIQPLLKDMIGPYCRSKFLAEQSVFRANSDGLPTISLSPTLPIGPGDINLTPPGQMISDYLQGKVPAYIDCTLNFVDVRDVALWHILASEKGTPGHRYILSGHNLSLYTFFLNLSRATGSPDPKWRIPYLLALWWAYLEHWMGLVTGKRPKSSVAGIKLCRRSLAFDGSRTWHELGHKPRPLDETIKDTVDWHRKYLSQSK